MIVINTTYHTWAFVCPLSLTILPNLLRGDNILLNALSSVPPEDADMIPIAKIRNLSYITISAHFILVNFKNSPPKLPVLITAQSSTIWSIDWKFWEFFIENLGNFCTDHHWGHGDVFVLATNIYMKLCDCVFRAGRDEGWKRFKFASLPFGYKLFIINLLRFRFLPDFYTNKQIK